MLPECFITIIFGKLEFLMLEKCLGFESGMRAAVV